MLVQKTRKSGDLKSKRWDDHHFAQSESHESDLASEFSQVIAIALVDTFDQTMLSQATD
jgi:hypothetical protein